MKNIAILGSTGSIGRQALEVVRHNPELFSTEVLTANNNSKLLIKQAKEFRPNAVVIANESKYEEISTALQNEPIKVYAGSTAIAQIVSMDSIDLILAAMVGYSGMIPVVNAIKAGKHIALANKEALVVAGNLITALAKKKGVNIIPVDSEHSAIFQCLEGESVNKVEKIILTCSGGPFCQMSMEQIKKVTPDDALRHPNWKMGSKITIDSASLMNKGFEVIEAHWLFGLKPEQIDVVIHKQSIIHSIVLFIDGSMKSQMGLPDMRLPIQYAMGYPERIKNAFPRLSLTDSPTLTFSKPDTKIFRNLALAFEALDRGGNLACVLNASNEVTVNAFCEGQISFPDMACFNENVMKQATFIEHPELEDYIESDREARAIAKELIKA